MSRNNAESSMKNGRKRGGKTMANGQRHNHERHTGGLGAEPPRKKKESSIRSGGFKCKRNG